MSGLSFSAPGMKAQSTEGVAAPALAMPLRLHILGIVLTALLPVLLAGTAWLWNEASNRQLAFRQSLAQAAVNMARGVETEFLVRRTVAVILSASEDFQSKNRQGTLENNLHTIGQTLDTFIFVINPPINPMIIDGTILTEDTPQSQQAAKSNVDETIQRLFATGQPQFGHVWRAPSLDAWVSAAFAPIRANDRITAVLGIGINLADFNSVLEAGLPPGSSWAVLVDDLGTIAAQSGLPAGRVGGMVPVGFFPANGSQDSYLFHGLGFDGAQQIIASARLPEVPGWRVAIGAPAATDQAAWRHPLLPLAMALLATLAIGAALALLLARRCLCTVGGLSDLARAVAAGQPSPSEFQRSGISEFDALRQSLERTTASLLRETAAAQGERALLQTVIDSTPDPVIVKGLDGKIQLANAAAGRAYGRDAASMVGETAIRLLTPECAAKEAAHDAAVLNAGGRVTEEHPILSTDRRIYRITKTPLQARHGGPVTGLVTIMHDTTEQRRSEAELRTAEAEMQHLGRRATVGVMASGLAHELNQPLTAATNYLRAAGRLLEGDDALRPDRLPVLREAVGAAAEQSLRAGEIVRRLREFLGRRTSLPVLEPVAAVVEEALRLALSGQVPPDLAVVTRLPPSLGSAMLDRVPVQQILVNLVRNAVEAMRGRTRQSLTVAARRVWADRQPWIEISVSDTGPGLPAEVAERLFEPFVGTKPDGLGVGLAICRRFAESQGGRIEAATNSGGGMIFTLTLPAGTKPDETKAANNDSGA